MPSNSFCAQFFSFFLVHSTAMNSKNSFDLNKKSYLLATQNIQA